MTSLEKQPANTLSLQQASFEVRYKNSLLLWDRAGAFWNTVERTWPKISSQTVEPARQTFQLDPTLQATVELAQSRLIGVNPGSGLRDFSDKAYNFLRVIQEILEVNSYTRVGLRLQFHAVYPSLSDASTAVLERFRPEKLCNVSFGTKATDIKPQIIMRWEGEALGCRLDVRSEEMAFAVNLPFGVNFPELNIPQEPVREPRVTFDIDLYTTTDMLASQLDAREWIRQMHHAATRDIKNVWS